MHNKEKFAKSFYYSSVALTRFQREWSGVTGVSLRQLTRDLGCV